jgi:hypothetical protein
MSSKLLQGNGAIPMHRLIHDPEHFQGLALRWIFAIFGVVEVCRILFLRRF